MSKKINVLKLALFLALAGILLTGCLSDIDGVVKDDKGNPLADAQVILESPKATVETFTDREGNWSASVSGDTVTISVEKPGYKFKPEQITIKTDDEKEIVFIGAASGEPGFAPRAGEYIDSATVSLHMVGDYTIYYTLNGSNPTVNSTKYTEPFTLTDTATVKAIAVNNADASDISNVSEAKYEIVKKNLFKNPGFENDQMSYAPWEPNDEWGNLTKMKIDTEVFVEGKQSLYVYDRESQAHGPYQYVDLDPNKTYFLSFKVRYDDPSSPGTKQFNFTYRDWGHDWCVFGLNSGEAVKGEWTEISGTFRINDIPEFHDQAGGVMIEPYIFIETPWRQDPNPAEDWMSFWVDDFTLIELE